MERPTMKENLPGYTIEEAHELYTKCPELYRQIVKLDNYIDYLESELKNLNLPDVCPLCKKNQPVEGFTVCLNCMKDSIK